MKKLILTLAVAAVLLSGSFFGTAPQAAKADTNSTIAIAAAAIIGILAFDTSNRPYYVREGRRVYVSNDVANYYIRERDPNWYNAHQYQWRNSRYQYYQSWNQNHGNGWYRNHANGWYRNHANGWSR